MPKALSLNTIKACIALPEAQARKVSAAEKPGLKAAIALIKKHRLSLSDISAALGKSQNLNSGALKLSTMRSRAKVKKWLQRMQVKKAASKKRFNAM